LLLIIDYVDNSYWSRVDCHWGRTCPAYWSQCQGQHHRNTWRAVYRTPATSQWDPWPGWGR